MTTSLLARASALLEAAEYMTGLLRDHTDELARGDENYVFTATDAYVELQVAANALRLHCERANTDDVSAFDALVAMHALLHEQNPQVGFDLSFVPGFGWISRIFDLSEITQKTLAYSAGETIEEACENVLDQLTPRAPIPESEIPY